VLCVPTALRSVYVLMATRKPSLIFTKEEIIFYFRTRSDVKEYNSGNGKGLRVRHDDIKNIYFLPANTKAIGSAGYEAVFELKSGVVFKTQLVEFGKQQEVEIFAYLKSLDEYIKSQEQFSDISAD